MKNKWFIWVAKLIAFMLLFFAIDRCVGYGVRFLIKQSVQKSPTSDKLRWILKGTEADVILIGASETEHSYISKVLMDSLNATVYNCGLDGRFLPSQTIIVNSIIDRYSPKLILWSVSPRFLTPDPGDNDRLSTFKPYYRENKRCREMLNKRSWSEPIKMLSYCYTYNSDLLGYLASAFKTQKTDDNYGYEPVPPAQVLPKYDEKEWENQPDSSYFSLFEKTVSRIKENNSHCIFILTPHYSYGDYQGLKGYYLLNKIIKDNGFVLVEDYFHHPNLMKDKYFVDRAHLNNEGALTFSRMLGHDLKLANVVNK